MRLYVIEYREKGKTNSVKKEQTITAHNLKSAKEIFNGTINQSRRFVIVKIKKV